MDQEYKKYFKRLEHKLINKELVAILQEIQPWLIKILLPEISLNAVELIGSE